MEPLNWPKSTWTRTRGSPRPSGSSPSRRSSPSRAARWSISSSAPCPRNRSLRSSRNSSLRQALELEAGHPAATEALARILIDRGEPDEALALLAKVLETPATRALAAEARLLESGINVAETGGAEVEARLNALLEVARDDEAARQEFVDLLETLGPEDPRTNTFPRALAARLF